MKKLVKILFKFCVFVNACLVVLISFYFDRKNIISNITCYAESEETFVYAKVLDNCILYKRKEMNSNFEDIYFQIPETYFVTILETISENCLKVQYGKYVGYVDSSKIEIAKFVPVVKTLDNITFDIKENVGTKIWQYPTTSSNVFTTLSAGTKNIVYIASILGQIPTGGKSGVWYYVYYTPSVDSTNVYEGYIYSENTTNLSDIVLNSETNPIEISDENIENEKLIFISTTIKTIVIAVIAIPIILFFAIILYNLIKKFRKNTKYNKNISKQEDSNIDDFARNQNIKSIEKYKNLRLVKNKNIQPKFEDFNDEELL